MKTKILFLIIIATLVLSITAISLGLDWWVYMLYPSSHPYYSILVEKIALNSVAVSFAGILLIITLFLLFYKSKNKQSYKVKLIIEIVYVVFFVYIAVILMLNTLDWIIEGEGFTDIILLNSTSFVLVAELAIYAIYILIKGYIHHRKMFYGLIDE